MRKQEINKSKPSSTLSQSRNQIAHEIPIDKSVSVEGKPMIKSVSYRKSVFIERVLN